MTRLFPSGIRKKITLGYYLLLIYMIGTAFLTYGFIKRVENKVELVAVIDDFLNTTLEVRRFEKNYFLYNKEEDFKENMAFWEQLEKLLYADIKMLTTLLSQNAYKQLWDLVHSYKTDMESLHQMDRAPPSSQQTTNKRFQLEDRIRTQGKQLTDIAEKTSQEERAAIKKLLKTTGTILILSLIIFVTFGISITSLMGRDVVRSLKVLEKHTKKISQGEYVAAKIKVADEEVNSLLHAFNRMTNDLRIRQQQLVQSEKLASLGTLLSGVAHELNNPLSNISTSAQILTEEIEEDDIEFKKNLIGQVIEQSDKARDIVKTLLEFSRLREFNKQHLFLRNLLDETILLLRGQIPISVDIHIEIPSDIEVIADKQRMQQVYLNLLKNAVDALEGEGNIWITARNIGKKDKPKEIEMIIEDDGPGIPSELLSKIFDPFFTTKDVGHGSGLGLYIVHDIIEWHGGTLKVDSRAGEGTSFIIWLPDKDDDGDRDGEQHGNDSKASDS